MSFKEILPPNPLKKIRTKMPFKFEGILLITGGTGSFGNAVLQKFLESQAGEIRIFSRDEKKQDDMRQQYKSNKLKFYLGDVRDRKSLDLALDGVTHCFHAAALKQVPSCEFHPMEAVRTNIIGTENVIAASVAAKVKHLVCLSTDKAVYPINAMGISKALMEKVMVAASRHSGETIISGTRYGNVIASRGSVVPLFKRQITQGQPITITEKSMTRFVMTLNDAVDLVSYAFENAQGGEIFVRKAPAATIGTLAEAIKQIMNAPNHETVIIGTRHGEKQFETLLSAEEMTRVEDGGTYFRVLPDTRDLNYSKYTEEGNESIKSRSEYNSENAQRLTTEETIALLQKAAGDSKHET